MARTKKTVVSGITREQAEQAFADFAAADAKVQNLTSKMDIEMTRIREKYADQLAELSATKEKNFDIMQAYAVENKEELFSKAEKPRECSWRIRFPYRHTEAEEPERFYLGSSNQHLQGIVAAIYPYNGRAGKRQAAG